MRALLITPDGVVQPTEVDDRDRSAALQRAVGGLIVTLHLTEDAVLMFNAEGKLDRLPANDIAIRLAQHFAVHGPTTWGEISGPAVIVGVADGLLVDPPAHVSAVLTRLGFPVAEEG